MHGLKAVKGCSIGVLILLLGGFFCQNIQAEPLNPGLQMTHPQKLLITSFFHGEEISIQALIPADHEVALRMLGPEEDLHLLEKGRVWGLWMNVRQVTFHHVPKLYLLHTSKNLSALADQETRDRLRMDYRSLLSRSLGTDEVPSKSLLLDQLIKLKEHDKLYQIQAGSIRIKSLGDGSLDQIDAKLPLPARISPGSYTLELISFYNGRGTLLQRKSIEVRLSGFPDLLYRLARENGLIYGVLAVVFATLSGLAIGVVFTSRGAH
jgi:uncharacterized protein (TIGR02186 family)